VVWQVGVLLVGIGFLVLSLFASFILVNMTRSLRTIQAILDDMVTGVNDKFTAADRAMNATGSVITGWRDRVRDALGGLGRRRGPQTGKQREES